MEGKFKIMDKIRTGDEPRPKFNLICIGNVKDNGTKVVLSEKAQRDQMWSTTTMKNAPGDLQKKSQYHSGQTEKTQTNVNNVVKTFYIQLPTPDKTKSRDV